eukprot:SAG31_NODE_30238_length_383_cov_11.345070_1_plen_38_part_01
MILLIKYIVAESKIGNYDYSLLRANMRARYITRWWALI